MFEYSALCLSCVEIGPICVWVFCLLTQTVGVKSCKKGFSLRFKSNFCCAKNKKHSNEIICALKKSLINNDYGEIQSMKEAAPWLECMPMRLKLIQGWYSHWLLSFSTSNGSQSLSMLTFAGCCHHGKYPVYWILLAF